MAGTKGELTYYTAQGERSYQEDRYVVIEDKLGFLLAVIDGHRGAEVAEFCKNKISSGFLNAVRGRNKASFDTLSEMIRILHNETKHMTAGSTISLVYIFTEELLALVSVLGDSPVVIRDNDGKLIVSPEHNVRTNEKEKESAIRRGAVYDTRGYIWNPEYTMGLQMSRALGNKDLDPFLNREPELYSVKLGPHSFVLLVSDGVVDPGHTNSEENIARLVAKIDQGADADDLVDDALDRRTGDNVTAILWKPKQ